ncbi:MAG: hypothetical protein KKA73_22085, partial [Chloroflexi bacterium]|nr:hypothetical protein [Chloroflexota bacterium]
VGYTGRKDVVTTRLLPLCRQAGLRAIFCDVDAEKRGDWIARQGPFCDVMFVNYTAAATGLNLIAFPTAVFFQVPYSVYTFQQAPARLRRPTQPLPVEVVYLNEAGTIVEQALALMFDKLSAASSFRGETLEGVLGEVASSGAFMDELMRRVVEDADVCGDLEALFARFCRQEVDRDEFLKHYELGIEDTVMVTATRHTRPALVSVDEVYQPVLFGNEPAPDRLAPTVATIDIQAAEQPALL